MPTAPINSGKKEGDNFSKSRRRKEVRKNGLNWKTWFLWAMSALGQGSHHWIRAPSRIRREKRPPLLSFIYSPKSHLCSRPPNAFRLTRARREPVLIASLEFWCSTRTKEHVSHPDKNAVVTWGFPSPYLQQEFLQDSLMVFRLSWGGGRGETGQWIETSIPQPLQPGDLACGSDMPRAQTLEQSGKPNVFLI